MHGHIEAGDLTSDVFLLHTRAKSCHGMAWRRGEREIAAGHLEVLQHGRRRAEPEEGRRRGWSAATHVVGHTSASHPLTIGVRGRGHTTTDGLAVPCTPAAAGSLHFF